jgi:hypothetical protein
MIAPALDGKQVPGVAALKVRCGGRQTLDRRITPSDGGETDSGGARRFEVSQLVADIDQVRGMNIPPARLLTQGVRFAEQARSADHVIESRKPMPADVLLNARPCVL